MASKSSILISILVLSAKLTTATPTTCASVATNNRGTFCENMGEGSTFVTGTEITTTECCEDICGECTKYEVGMDEAFKSDCCTTGTAAAAIKTAEIDTAVSTIFDSATTQVTIDNVVKTLKTLVFFTQNDDPVDQTVDHISYTKVYVKNEAQREAFRFRVNSKSMTKAANDKIRQKYQKKDAKLRLKAIKKAAAAAAVIKNTKRQTALATCDDDDELCKTAFSKKEAVKQSKIELEEDDLVPIVLNALQTAAYTKIEMVVAPLNVAADNCAGTRPNDNCCTYNIQDDAVGNLVMLSVPATVDAWGVLCDGDTILAKLTMKSPSEDTYDIQCGTSAGAFGTAVTKSSGAVVACNGKDILIGSQTILGAQANRRCAESDCIAPKTLKFNGHAIKYPEKSARVPIVCCDTQYLQCDDMQEAYARHCICNEPGNFVSPKDSAILKKMKAGLVNAGT